MAITVKSIGTGSTGNSYLISNGYTRILLDAGLPVRKIRAVTSLTAINGALITHSHRDHCQAVPELLNAPTEVWMPEREIEAYRKIAVLKDRWNLHPIAKLSLSPIEYATFSIGAFTVLPFAAEHDTPEPVGYLLQSHNARERILYLTDSQYVSALPSWVTHIICECNFVGAKLYENVSKGIIDSYRYARTLRTHMSCESLVAALKQMNQSELKEIYVCHMSNDNGDEEFIRNAVQDAAPNAKVVIL